MSSNKLVKLHAGLDYLLLQPKATYSALMNKSLVAKIQEFRDLRSQILPSNSRLGNGGCSFVAITPAPEFSAK
jgi:hypothetical protein